MLVTGPSGSGKSTLFRAIAGIWPFGKGTRRRCRRARRLMTLPQRPYLPIGTLGCRHRAIRPSPARSTAAQLPRCSRAVGLPALAERLDEDAHWNRMLSLGEQQRLGIARAILHAPDFLFLDEATASLDEPAEAALYKLLKSGCRTRPSFRSATARRLRRSIAAASGWSATGPASASANAALRAGGADKKTGGR